MRRRPDTELIVLARKGSTEAVDVLFDRYWPHAWKAAYAITASRELADDAAQEAIAQAFGALHRFDETRPFGPWLKRITANRAIDLLRRRRHEVSVDVEELLAIRAAVSSGDDDLRLCAARDAVSALAESQRLVVVLHYWLDLSIEEVAGTLGIPVGTVASRLARAKAALRAALEEQHAV